MTTLAPALCLSILSCVPSQDRVAERIEALGDDDIDVRERASHELRGMLDKAFVQLVKALKHPDAEVAARCRDLLLPPPRTVTCAGQIVLVDKDRGIAIDFFKRHGAAVGQELRVRRSGKTVGWIVITTAQVWGSWAKPGKGTPLSNLRKGDRWELLQEK